MIKKIFEINRIFLLMFFRDKMNLFFSFFFNAFLMIMLGFFVKDKFNEIGVIGIYDNLQTEVSREFIEKVSQYPNLNIDIIANYSEIEEKIKKGKIVAAVQINKSFENLFNDTIPIKASNDPQLTIYGNSGKQFWMKMMEPGFKLTILGSNEKTKKLTNFINIDTSLVQTRDVDYFKFIFPGILVFSIMGLAFSGALTLLRFKNTDVLKRLKITPLKKFEFLTGFTISYMILLLLQTILYIVLAATVFGYTFNENILQIAIIIFTCGLVFMVLGICLANISPSLDSGNNIVRFINYPASFICGVFIPIETLPKVFQFISYFHPLTYFSNAIRNAVNYSATFVDNLSNYIIIFSLLIIFSVISVITFKWEEQSN